MPKTQEKVGVCLFVPSQLWSGLIRDIHVHLRWFEQSCHSITNRDDKTSLTLLGCLSLADGSASKCVLDQHLI